MAESSYPDALPAQYRLHWYVLERVLGQGGFGITYLARDTNLDQAVAIKEYLPVDVATRRADATVRARSDEQNERYRWGLERFIREARTLARFDHPNIVRVLSVFEHNNTAYMVMRFEEGENFAALLERRRTLPEAELVRVLLPVIDGLALVHEANFIHRDIKPDNIHVRDDGSPVLLDFGSARFALGQARTVTILVAPGYAPFEQYYSSGENQGPWTDIYALGATCYRAISGIAPMDAIARSKGILGSTRELLVPASAIGKGRYSDRLLAAIDHALEFSEKDRPQSLGDWRRELAPPETETASAASQAARPRTVLEPSPASAGTVAPEAGSRASQYARGPIIGAVVGAMVAVVAVVIYLQPGAERDKLAQALQQSHEERQRLQAQQEELARREAEVTRQLETRERQQREEQARREAEAKSAPPVETPAPAKKTSPIAARETKVEPPRARVQSPSAPAKPSPPERPAAAPPAAKSPEATPVATTPAQEPPNLESEKRPALAEAPARKVEAVPSGGTKPTEATSIAKTAADDRTRALQGDASAQFKLGENYEAGRGVAQNFFQAYYWYSAAARRGHSAAKAKQDQMAARLQPAEIQQADRLVERLARSPK